MRNSSVVVTFSVNDAQRQAIKGSLPEDVAVVYLDEVGEARREVALEEAEFLLAWALDGELTDEETECLRADQTLQLLSAGVDFVSFDRLPDGMRVLNNAGAYAEPMAEHALSLYCALSKRLGVEHRNMRNGEFNQFSPTRWIRGSVCGIFGFGAVGVETARLLRSLGVKVMAINRHGETDAPVDFIGTPDDLDYVLEACDGLIVSAPSTPETRGAITHEELSRMKDDGMLINIARGEIIDQDDLYEHLRANPEFQVGLEAWWIEPVRHGKFELDHPFLDLPNVIGSPHNSAMVPDAMELATRHAAENIRRAITSDDPDNVVDQQLGY